jgi:hypothetical protein
MDVHEPDVPTKKYDDLPIERPRPRFGPVLEMRARQPASPHEGDKAGTTAEVAADAIAPASC